MTHDELLMEIVHTSPLVLLTITDKELLDKADKLLPYSTGFEIECSQKIYKGNTSFLDIPDIIDVDCDGSEQRFRIPNGIKGLICLYNISQQLKRVCELNPLSGIHYHVDTTDCFNLINASFVKKIETETLSRLDKWEYKGTYNSRAISLGSGHDWIRKNTGFSTIEFRLGEMTFDYALLVKRIIDVNSIIAWWKSYFDLPAVKFQEVDKLKILNYLKTRKIETPETLKLLKTLNTMEEESRVTPIYEEPKIEIKNRIVKI